MWAAYDGLVAGGVPVSECNVSAVRVKCGGRTMEAEMTQAVARRDPASTGLVFEPAFLPGGRTGSFTVHPMLKTNDGTSRVLCSVPVSFQSGESAETVLERAAAAINTSSTCVRAGVTAAVLGTEEPGQGEDVLPPWLGLVLSAPTLTGIELVTAVSGSVHAELAVDHWGVLATASAVVPRLALSGTAQGGTVRVTALTPLGSCGFEVATTRGESAAAVAAKVQDAFLARHTPPETLVFEPSGGCLNLHNARDVYLSGAELQFALANRLAVHNTDAGLTFTLDTEH